MSTSPFLRRLAEPRPLLLDAAMGTALLERGLSLPREDAISWSLARPGAVREVHRAHVHAGAELLLANTFGARAPSQIELGAAIALARESGAAWTGVALWPGLSARSFAEAVLAAASAGQSQGQGGDVIWLETAMRFEHAARALHIAREECELPVAVTLALAAFPSQPRASGVSELREQLARLAEQGAAIVGVNCGPWDMAATLELEQLVRDLIAGLSVPFALKPDAGARTPEAWAEVVTAALRTGAKLAGGCCGTDARHLRALRAASTTR